MQNVSICRFPEQPNPSPEHVGHGLSEGLARPRQIANEWLSPESSDSAVLPARCRRTKQRSWTPAAAPFSGHAAWQHRVLIGPTVRLCHGALDIDSTPGLGLCQFFSCAERSKCLACLPAGRIPPSRWHRHVLYGCNCPVCLE